MSKMRMQRVAGLIREVVGEMLSVIKDPRIGFVTITDVVVSPDLEHANIFVSTLAEGKERERALQGLESATGYIRRQLGKEIRLKKTPKVTFCFDSGIERGMKVLNILNQIHHEQKQEVSPEIPEQDEED